MDRATLATVLQLVGVGWYVALCIVGGTLGGLWLDRTLETLPVFTLIGVTLGAIVAMYGTYKMVIPLVKNSYGERKDNEER